MTIDELTVRLVSGIGNNFYQIATAYHIAKTNGVKKYTVIHPKDNANIQEIRQYGGHYTPLKDELPSRIQEIFPNVNWVSMCNPDAYILHSYIFQYSAFADSLDEIKQILKPSESLVDYINKKYSHIFTGKTAGIHLRFTSGSDSFPPEANNQAWFEDILNKNRDKFDNVVVVSNRTYYANVFMNNYREKNPDKNVYVIEDEPNFVDFWILSMCNLIICSNSTFSFWSAMLSDAKDIYISPEYKPAMCRDAIPPHWHTNSDVFYQFHVKE